MKKYVLIYVLITGLILLLLNSFLSISALCEEKSMNEDDPEVIGIKKGITDMMNNLIYHNTGNVMGYFPPGQNNLKSEAEEKIKYLEQFSVFSCGEPKVLNYEHTNNKKTLIFEFTIECSGFDNSVSKEVDFALARRVTLNRDENSGNWQIVDSQEINPSRAAGTK